MKFYYLKLNPEAFGTVPQESRVMGDYNFNDPCSVYNIASIKEYDRIIFPKGLYLKPRAKFTDLTVLSIILYALVFSEAFNQVLKNFKLPEGRWDQLILKKGKTERMYTLYCPYSQSDSYLDFKSAEFELFDREERQSEMIEINNYEEYLSLKESLNFDKQILCRHPKFNPEVIKEDLFLMPSCANGFGYIVTEPLKVALENAGLTGVTLEEVI